MPLEALYILWLVIIVVPELTENQKVAKAMEHVLLIAATNLLYLTGYQI